MTFSGHKNLSFKIRLPHIYKTMGIPVFLRKTTAAQGVNSLVKKYMYLKYIYFMLSMLLIHLHMYVLYVIKISCNFSFGMLY